MGGLTSETASGCAGSSISSAMSVASDEEKREVDMYDFVAMANRLRQRARLLFRNNVGYNSAELEELEERFKQYDTDGSGDINNKELPKLLEDLFPELATSAHLRPDLLKLLKEIDVEEDLELDFPDFLRLVRQFHDLQEKERIMKEQDAVRSTNFTFCEVEEFRELFMGEA